MGPPPSCHAVLKAAVACAYPQCTYSLVLRLIRKTLRDLTVSSAAPVVMTGRTRQSRWVIGRCRAGTCARVELPLHLEAEISQKTCAAMRPD